MAAALIASAALEASLSDLALMSSRLELTSVSPLTYARVYPARNRWLPCSSQLRRSESGTAASTVTATTAFGALRSRKFVHGQGTVFVAVEFHQGGGGVLDFLSGNFAIAIGIQCRDDRQIGSSATTLDEIVAEALTATRSERETRLVDQGGDSMEDKKRDGYF